MHYNTLEEIPDVIRARQAFHGRVEFAPHGSTIEFSCESYHVRATVQAELKEIALSNAIVRYLNPAGEHQGFHTHDQANFGGFDVKWSVDDGHSFDNRSSR